MRDSDQLIMEKIYLEMVQDKLGEEKWTFRVGLKIGQFESMNKASSDIKTLFEEAGAELTNISTTDQYREIGFSVSGKKKTGNLTGLLKEYFDDLGIEYMVNPDSEDERPITFIHVHKARDWESK